MKFELLKALKKLQADAPLRTQMQYVNASKKDKTFTFSSPFTQKKYAALWNDNQDLREVVSAFVHNKWSGLSLGDPKVIVDLGSNNGYSSLYFKDRFPNASVYLIDLLQSNIMFSNRLFDLNGISSHHVNTAISKFDGFIEVDLHPSHARSRLSSLLDKNQRDEFGFKGRNISVGTKRLKTLMADLKIEKIDLLKVDIEGAEQYLVEDIDQWYPIVDMIVMEVHHNVDKAWCEKELLRVGYSVNKVEDDWLITR